MLESEEPRRSASRVEGTMVRKVRVENMQRRRQLCKVAAERLK